jgi:hypothetical protein
MSHGDKMIEYWKWKAANRIIHSHLGLNFCRSFLVEGLRITIKTSPLTFLSAAEIWVVDVSNMKQDSVDCARDVDVYMKFQIDSLH